MTVNPDNTNNFARAQQVVAGISRKNKRCGDCKIIDTFTDIE
jgi:hypothetical protein